VTPYFWQDEPTHWDMTWRIPVEAFQPLIDSLPLELRSQVLFQMIGDKASVCTVMHSVATTGKLPPGFPIQAEFPMPRR